MPWQRRLRFALALFIPLFVLGVYLSVRKPASGGADAKPPAPKVDPQAAVHVTKGHLVWSKGAQLDIVVEYDELITYADGTSKFVGVNARIPERSDRDFTVKAREGRGRGTQGDELLLEGNVDVRSSDGLVLLTDSATYTKASGAMKAPGAVTFSRGRLSGTSNGMTYDQGLDVLSLLDKAVIHIAADESGAGGADIEAGLARLGRREHYVRFERGVKIVRDGQTTTADEAIAYFTDDEKYIKVFSLRGSSRIAGAAAKTASGGLRSMSARDIDLYYREASPALDHAVLMGGGVIELAGSQPRTVRRIAGDSVDARLGADGATVTGLMARRSVQLDLPAENGTPARRINAAELDATGPEDKGLTSAVFRGGTAPVEFREFRPSPAAPRVARSATMDLSMPEGLGSIESARFNGGVRFEEDDMAAVAREARYVLASGMLALSGLDERTKQPPRVLDDQVTIEAKRVEIGLDGRKISASDTVKSDLRPKKPGATSTPPAGKPAKPGGKPGPERGESRLPSMLKQDQPVSATSDTLEYDGSASHAIYSGHAQLWQGDTTIKGDRIVLDDGKGDLSASGNVVTNMRLEQVNEKTKAKEQVNSIATSKEMVYQEDLRRATYTGDAHLNGPQGDLRADKIELFLKEGGSEVERLEAYTNVTITTPEGRKATGARLTFLSADERYTMLGAPVKIVEECRETTGKSLTFFRSADRIIIDGNEQKRTETKGASACGSGPRSSD